MQIFLHQIFTNWRSQAILLRVIFMFCESTHSMDHASVFASRLLKQLWNCDGLKFGHLIAHLFIQDKNQSTHYFKRWDKLILLYPCECSPDFTMGSNESKIRAIIIALVPRFFGSDFLPSCHDVTCCDTHFWRSCHDIMCCDIMTLIYTVNIQKNFYRSPTLNDQFRHDNWR